MTLLQSLFHLTDFKNPFLRTLVPSVSAAYAIQALFGLPSVLAQSERFFDVSGSLTYLAVAALSLYLPSLRARNAAVLAGLPKPSFPSLLAPFTNPAGAALNWRQVFLTGAVTLWATRLGSYLFKRILQDGHDSRFEKIRTAPKRFSFVFFAQATWVTLCALPIIAINSVPATAFAALPGARVFDVLGAALFAGGLGFEMLADWQKTKWLQQKKAKVHDEEFMTRGLWTRSQYPNYFGEITLWTGIATLAAGALVAKPVLGGLGFAGGLGSKLGMISLSYVSPAFVAFLLTKVSGISKSEPKYDAKFGHRKDYQEWKANTPRLFPKIF